MKKVRLVSLMFLIMSSISVISYAQSPSKVEQEVLQVSKDKWEWMANKDVVKLGELFDAKAKFVHMSGSWKTDRELEIIESGSIWYKEAIVHHSAVEVSKKTAIVWNRITLVAQVRGNDVSNEFTVTEVYQKKHGEWKMLGLTFSSVRDTHQIEKQFKRKNKSKRDNPFTCFVVDVRRAALT